MGHPDLWKPSRPVGPADREGLTELIQDLLDTMRAASGAGIAAPQIGVPLRVVIFGFESNPRYPDAEPVPFTVLVNPVVEPIGADRDEDWEGCLSVPGMRGLVPRYRRIRYRGEDEIGATIDREVTGFHARVVQHEVDHLDGILYPQRIERPESFGFIQPGFPPQAESGSDAMRRE